MSVTSDPKFDLADPGVFKDGIPHEYFKSLRDNDPVHWVDEPDGAGFWAVTRYEDIRAVHRDVETFSSELGGSSLEDLEPEHLENRKSMIDMDPPRHDELRGLIARRFTPKAVHVWDEQVRMVAKEVIDLALEKDEFDFIAEISSEIPMWVFAEIMGIPQKDRRKVIKISDRMLGFDDPDYAVPNPEDYRHLSFSHPASQEMNEYGQKLARERREHPTEDLITQLAFEPLTQREYDNYFLLLAAAGNETTRHSITYGLIALLENPEQMEAWRGDKSLGKSATEEILRWASAVHHFRRTATRDTELNGTKIKAGDKVTTWFGSGNFDESVFDEPTRFDIRRSPNRHMAFGPGGIHHCMGAHLARLEIQLVFEDLLARPERLELTGPPERLRSNMLNAVKRLPVRVNRP